jgi:hypothetical protein
MVVLGDGRKPEWGIMYLTSQTFLDEDSKRFICIKDEAREMNILYDYGVLIEL